VDLVGKTALVTGGASGLGRTTAHVLAEAGADVVVVDLETSDGSDVAKAVGGEFAAADVTSEEDMRAAVALAAEQFGGLHVAVSCAGVAIADRILGKEGPHDLDSFRRVVDVNHVGTFNVCPLAAAQMSAQEPDDGGERGVIVNTASIAAYEGQIGQVAYAASKAGVVGMTLPVARDLAGRGIRCVTIAPGVFDTPMLAALPEEIREQLAAGIPHPRRLGRPDDYALLVRQIVENPYLNGEVIRLDGALRMPPR
jgi:NAD(P)-dependent dehydrogenase (short-subunit alcohol dehydrogenase family)